MQKILVVEDEPAYIKLLHDQLTARGYEVIDAKDGLEGLKLALAKKPDLILLDLIMPKIDGFKMLNILRRFKWGEAALVFILTNANGSDDMSKALDTKASKYFVKSDLRFVHLLESVQMFLQRG